MKNQKRLSIEKLKAFPGCENYTDEKAEEIIATLEELSILFYELHQKSLLEREKLKVFS
jgi:hypothetical protein